MKTKAKKYFNDLFDQYPALKQSKHDIFSAFSILVTCYKKGGKLLVCGNGGSAADSEHIVGELMKEFRIKRPVTSSMANRLKSIESKNSDYIFQGLQQALPAISLVSQISLFTAYANDVDVNMTFAQQVYGYAQANDVLLAISTSGNSPNVCNAAHVARALDIPVIGLTGENGGNLAKFCTVIVAAPSSHTYSIQEYHLPIYHTICLALEEEFFGT
jgi:D-sedoheptulose 7-phosphate isomerase